MSEAVTVYTLAEEIKELKRINAELLLELAKLVSEVESIGLLIDHWAGE